MIGHNREFELISYEEMKRAEIEDCLFTPLGSRPIHKEWGSEIYLMTDQPVTDQRRMKAIVLDALDRNIEDYEIERITVEEISGGLKLSVFGLIPSLDRKIFVGLDVPTRRL